MADRPDPPGRLPGSRPPAIWTTGDGCGKGREFPSQPSPRRFGRLLCGSSASSAPRKGAAKNDLWERQRVFNLILLEYLRKQESWTPNGEKRTTTRPGLPRRAAFEGSPTSSPHDPVFAASTRSSTATAAGPRPSWRALRD